MGFAEREYRRRVSDLLYSVRGDPCSSTRPIPRAPAQEGGRYPKQTRCHRHERKPLTAGGVRALATERDCPQMSRGYRLSGVGGRDKAVGAAGEPAAGVPPRPFWAPRLCQGSRIGSLSGSVPWGIVFGSSLSGRCRVCPVGRLLTPGSSQLGKQEPEVRFRDAVAGADPALLVSAGRGQDRGRSSPLGGWLGLSGAIGRGAGAPGQFAAFLAAGVSGPDITGLPVLRRWPAARRERRARRRPPWRDAGGVLRLPGAGRAPDLSGDRVGDDQPGCHRPGDQSQRHRVLQSRDLRDITVSVIDRDGFEASGGRLGQVAGDRLLVQAPGACRDAWAPQIPPLGSVGRVRRGLSGRHGLRRAAGVPVLWEPFAARGPRSLSAPASPWPRCRSHVGCLGPSVADL
jgi:hypothetical protein